MDYCDDRYDYPWTEDAMLTVYRLDDEEVPTAICGIRDCEEPAFMWSAEGLDGYVDTCEGHAVEVVLDAMRRAAERMLAVDDEGDEKRENRDGCPRCYHPAHKGPRSYCDGGQD